MGRFVLSQLRYRKSRTLTLAAGILLAAVSFTLLTSAASTSELRVKRTVAENFQPAYDILVRPSDSFTELERTEGLIQQNYLSGIFGGITRQQYRDIEAITGVEVAAPIANVGFVPPFEALPIDISPYLSDAPESLYRLKVEWLANNGLSRYPDQDAYVYLTRRDPFVKVLNGLYVQRPAGSHRSYEVCGHFYDQQQEYGTAPFRLDRNVELGCYSAVTPKIGGYRVDFGSLRFPNVGTVRPAFFPMLVAAIDPEKEQQLLDLGGAIVSGRMLTSDDGVGDASEGQEVFGLDEFIPLLASTRTYTDEEVEVTVELLDAPTGRELPSRLSRSNAYSFARGLEGREVGSFKLSLKPVYERLLDKMSVAPEEWDIGYPGYWQTSPVHYDVESEASIVPRAVRNPAKVFVNNYYGCCWAPQENRDVQFRKVRGLQANAREGNVPKLVVVGRFDPGKLPGFSELSRVPLETYYPPLVEAADARTGELLGGRDLLPTQNLGGYVSQPPLLLTTLGGLRALTDSSKFYDASDDAPISVIRVRVSGVTGPDQVSRERIRRVAEEIHATTGLSVDITAGSSPHPVTVELPAGNYGQPPLTVTEGWVEKGVAVRFLEAVDTKSIILLALILVVCSVFLGNSTTASVKARRVEIGTLACLGWPRSKIFAAVLGEVAMMGLLSGIAGFGLALAVISILSLDMTVLHSLLVVPVAVVLALVAGCIPAWRAAKTVPLDAIRFTTSERLHATRLRGLLAMAVTNILRRPSRTALGVVGLAVGVAALTLLITVNRAFQGVLVGNLMGNFISLRIRGVDLLSAVFVVLLGAGSVADVLFLNLRERAPELVTLRTFGWRQSHLLRLAAFEAFAMGVVGSALGVGIALLVASQIQGFPMATTAIVALMAFGAGVFVALAASLVPMAKLSELLPTTLLAEE